MNYKGGSNIQRKINCLYIEPNQLPKKIEVKNNLYSKQNLVGGNIEYCRILNDDNVVLICNEEGKINGMEPNRDVGHDIIFGPFLIVGDDSEIGEDRSLTEDQINKYKTKFGIESIYKTNAKIEAIKMNKLKDYEI